MMCEFPEFQLSPPLPCDDEQEKGQMPEEKKKENDEGNKLSFYNCDMKDSLVAE